MSAAPPGRIAEIVRYFLRLGLLGFGGSVALVGQMERELVAERDWFTVLVGLLSLAALFRWKVSNPLLMAVTAALG